MTLRELRHMRERRDPVESASDGSYDLYDVATWEPRSWLDRLAIRIYSAIVRIVRTTVVLVALVILIAQFALTGLAALANPVVGAFTLLSVVPALALAAYVWHANVTQREPLRLLVATFLLGVLFAGFAAILNTLARPGFERIPIVGIVLFFYLIVAPVEETVKWLAIRLYAYRSDAFDAVVDGAVYGAMAGLGFATIENGLFIGRQYLSAMQSGAIGPPVFEATFGTAAIRTFAGPGHVIYSAFAGYYLGLAKFNRENAGPIVVKGLLIAAFIHATYNTTITFLPTIIAVAPVSISPAVSFIGFVFLYDGIFGFALYRKLARYRAVFTSTNAASRRDANRDDPDASVDARGDGTTTMVGPERSDDPFDRTIDDPDRGEFDFDAELDDLTAFEGDPDVDDSTERDDTRRSEREGSDGSG